jgi:hypothetical protein
VPSEPTISWHIPFVPDLKKKKHLAINIMMLNIFFEKDLVKTTGADPDYFCPDPNKTFQNIGSI